MKWTLTDSVGFLLAAAITTIPFVVIILLFAGNIKDPVRPEHCRVAALISIAAAVVASGLAWRAEGSSREPDFRAGSRLFTYGGYAALTLVLLVLTFFLGWGEWAQALSGRGGPT